MIFMRYSLLVFTAIFAILLTGCNPRAVETLTLNAPETLETNQSGEFSAAANEEARPPVMYAWEFGDGSTADSSYAAHTYGEAGSYTVTVTASNRNGRFSISETTNVMVMDPPVPAQVLALLASSTSVDTRTPVEFSANVRGDAPLTYAWNFGDGTSSASPRPQHTFMAEGQYGVSLEVSNEHGRDARTLTVTVEQYEPPYCADLAEMSTVFFERNSSLLTDSVQGALADNLEILGECLNLQVRVEGMASALERNAQTLSEDRARAVRDHYIANGIDANRITTAGVGSADGSSKKSGADQFRRADTIPLR